MILVLLVLKNDVFCFVLLCYSPFLLCFLFNVFFCSEKWFVSLCFYSLDACVVLSLLRSFHFFQKNGLFCFRLLFHIPLFCSAFCWMVCLNFFHPSSRCLLILLNGLFHFLLLIFVLVLFLFVCFYLMVKWCLFSFANLPTFPSSALHFVEWFVLILFHLLLKNDLDCFF